MIFYRIGDLLTAPQTRIAHQVNCRGKMGSGVALAIKQKYPEVYQKYSEACKVYKKDFLYGSCQKIVCKDKIVYNLFGQDGYGYDGKQYTSYAFLTIALEKMFEKIKSENVLNEKISVAIPYKMGCDRGGADWKIVESIIEDLSSKYSIDVYIYSINGY